MPLTAGTRLGAYDIVSALGAGGMGEVYRATDPSLGREVAIKVLPDSVAQDPERLARFDREAKLLASLSHPNIAQVYGLEEEAASRRRFLVMELAAGDDLTVRISRGRIPVDEAIPIAIQIAHALEAAHGRGIVHRDLKPANIKLSANGDIKVLDFGLAKAFDSARAGASGGGAAGSDAQANSPTLTAQATAAGVILGTAAYMSPEQARGREADKRADIWSFGVVLFEMLTGARFFQGETISDTLAAVLRQEIDWASLPADTPAEIRRLLRRCLERDRKNRLHDIADARIVLEEISRGAKEPAPAPLAAPKGRSPWMAWVAIAVVMLAAGAAIGRWTVGSRASGAAQATIRLDVRTPPGVTDVRHPAVAPDGSFVVFVGESAKAPQLYLQKFDEAAPRAIDLTEGARQPFVSPDGRWIGFRRANRLERIAVDGGEPLPIADASTDGPGATWVPGGPIVFGTGWLQSLSAVSPEGGAVRQLTKLNAEKGEIGHWYPAALPDGRHVLFTVWAKATGLNDAETALLNIDTGEYRTLFKGAEARYVEPGAIVFFRAGAYHAVRFDPATFAVSGEPVRVLEDARGNVPAGTQTNASLSAGGTLAYTTGSSAADRKLVWVSPGGALAELPFPARAYNSLSIAPGGRRAAVGVLEAGRHVIRLLDFEQRTDDALDLPGSNWYPVWHPDGVRLAFRSMRKGDFDTYWKDASSAAPPEELLVTDRDDTPIAFTPDGKALVVEQSEADGTYPFKMLSLPPTGAPAPLVPFKSGGATITRDGKLMALVSARAGRDDVYVLPLGGKGTPERVSTGGGQAVAWSSNGTELYFARFPEILVTTIRLDAGRVRASGERVWARVEGADLPTVFAPGPDGRLLLALRTEPMTPSIRVVIGWDKEIARKLAVGASR